MGLDPLVYHTTSISGMEHEKASQRIEDLLKDDAPPSILNGSSSQANFYNDEDDDAAIEAVAAEASISMMRGNDSINKPLHVQINGFNSARSGMDSSSSTSSYGQSRPSSLVRTVRPETMGPPLNSSTKSLLSPAAMIGNSNNGFSMRSSDPSPASPSSTYRPRIQSLYQQSPSIQREYRPSGLSSPSTSSFKTSLSTYRYAQQPAPARKDLEVSKRRICTDYIQLMREENALKSLLPGMEEVTNNQIGMIMRKFYKTGLMCEDLPPQVRQSVFDDNSDRKGRSVSRHDRGDMADYKTDSSDDEEMQEPSSSTQMQADEHEDKKISPALSRWLEEKMKFGRMSNKCDFLIEEKLKERRKAMYENVYRTRTGRAWMEGEEIEPPRELRKRRNQEDLILSLPPVVEKEGCARERPLACYARRKLYRQPFLKGDRRDEARNHLRDPMKANEVMKYTGQVTLRYTDDDRVEIIDETIETEDMASKGGAVLTAAHVVYEMDDDAIQGIVTRENNFFGDQLLSYYHRLSTVPSMTLRTSPNRSTLLATGEDEKMRSGLIKGLRNIGKKFGKKTEKRAVYYDEVDGEELDEEMDMEEMIGSSDDDEWVMSTKPSPKKKPPKKVVQKPAKNQKKSTTLTQQPTRMVTRNANWKLDDYYVEDLGALPPLPAKLNYARIMVPTWEKVNINWSEYLPSTSTNGSRDASRNSSPISPTSHGDGTSASLLAVQNVDELTMTVARAHHALTFLEQEKVKRSLMNKQQRNEKSKMAPLSKTAGQGTSVDSEVVPIIDEQELLRDLPPFRVQSLFEEKPKVTRRFASTASPHTLREFDASSKKLA